MSARRLWTASLALLCGCATPPAWQSDLPAALSATRAARQELVVFFALPGREMSDRMQARIGDPVVMEALVSIKRAGADGILTYYALQAAEWLRGSS